MAGTEAISSTTPAIFSTADEDRLKFITRKLGKYKRKNIPIKNYPELCQILEMTPYNGKQKVYQLKDLERFVVLEQQGRSFIVKTIRTKPKAKEDKRVKGSNRIVFLENIEKILLSYFTIYNIKEITISKSHLWKLLGFTNDNFAWLNDKDYLETFIEQFPEYETKQYYISNFYSYSRKCMLDAAVPALESMQRRNLISVSEVVTGYFYSTDEEGNVSQGAQIITDEKQLELISYIEQLSVIAVLRGEIEDVNENGEVFLRPPTLQDIRVKRKYKQYMVTRNIMLNAEIPGLQYVYKQYHIICNDKLLNNRTKLYKANYEKLKYDNNQKMINKITATLQNDYDRNKQFVQNKLNKAEPECQKDVDNVLNSIFHYSYTYMSLQKKLIRRFLNINFIETNEELQKSKKNAFGENGFSLV